MILGFHYWTNEKIDASDVLKKSGAPFLVDCSEKTLYIPKQTIQMCLQQAMDDLFKDFH